MRSGFIIFTINSQYSTLHFNFISRNNPELDQASDEDSSTCCMMITWKDHEPGALEALRNYNRAILTIHFHKDNSLEEESFIYEADIRKPIRLEESTSVSECSDVSCPDDESND